MGFVDNLAAAGQGSSGIFNPGGGEPTGQMYADALSLHNQIKDRELQDFKAKANFMSDLEIRQDRLRRIYGDQDQQTQAGQPQGQMNTVMHDPNAITAYQKGELGIRQQEADTAKAGLAQRGQLGQEAIDVRSAQEKLNEQKSKDIYDTKQADLERKTNEAQERIRVAEEKIKQAGTDYEKRTSAMKEHYEAMDAWHKLQMEQNQSKFDKLQEEHKKALDSLDRYRRAQTGGKIKVEGDSSGASRSTYTGPAGGNVPKKNPDGSYSVIGPDGTPGKIPADKLNDWMQNHMQPLKQQDQQDQQEDQGDNE